MVASCPILREALVRRDHQATVADGESPQVRVRQALINGPANILDIMAEFAQVIEVMRGMFLSTRIFIRQ
jgi:hypothetical protein